MKEVIKLRPIYKKHIQNLIEQTNDSIVTLYQHIISFEFMCLFILIHAKYLVFIRSKEDKNTFDIIFRNPYYLNTSYEFFERDSKQADKMQTFEVERSLMGYNKVQKRLVKSKLLEITEILNTPEFRSSFSQIDESLLMYLKGFMSIDYGSKKKVIFKIVDKKIDGGVKCGTGGMSQSNLMDKVIETEKRFVDIKRKYKKTEVCMLLELALRYKSFENEYKKRTGLLGAVDRFYLDTKILNKNLI